MSETTTTNASASVIVIYILMGILIVLLSYWWKLWIVEHNPLLPPKRGNLQFVLVFLLLWSCWFVAFSITRQDLNIMTDKKREKNESSSTSTATQASISPKDFGITMATYAVCCVGLVLLGLLLDCFCVGRAPHLIPPGMSVIALFCSCTALIPGMTVLSVYYKYYNDIDNTNTNTNETTPIDDYDNSNNNNTNTSIPHEEYLNNLKLKGWVGIGIGSMVNLVVFLIWIRLKRIKASMTQNRQERQEEHIIQQRNNPSY